MLGSSTVEADSHRSSKLNPKGETPNAVDSLRMVDINENVKEHLRKPTETDLTCKEKMEVVRDASFQSQEEQDLFCNESVANDSAEFDSKSKDHALNNDDDGNNLVIDLGENQNQNNNKMDLTPAILKAVSLANANSMVARPTMVPPSLSVKRDPLDVRPSPLHSSTNSTPPSGGGTKLTKKGTVPVREAVDPAKYVRLQDVDGVRYACSKCGNVYKWRKSLNKHWKEKHDGEIPVPASGSFTMLNIPHIKGGPAGAAAAAAASHYSTPKSSVTSARTLVSPSMLTSSGAISSYALDKYIVDMGAHSGGRHVQSSYNSTNSSPAAAAAAAMMATTRGMLHPKQAAFGAMLPTTNIPFTAAHMMQQHLPLTSLRFMKPESTATTNALPRFHPNFNSLPQEKLRVSSGSSSLSAVPPPVAHAHSFMKHEIQEEDSCEDMPLDLSKKSTATNVLDLTASMTPSAGSSRPGSGVTTEQPLDFSIKSNPGSERSTPVHSGLGRGPLDRDELLEHPWMRQTSTPESDVYNNLQCYKCPYVARDKVSFEEHLEQHANYSQYPQCAQCKQHFSSNDELTQHFGLHHLHILNQAGDDKDGAVGTTPDSGQLFQYLTKPHEYKEQKCIVCSAKFPWQRDLARHFTHLHPDLPNPYKKRKGEAGTIANEPWHKVAKFERYGSNEGKQGTSEGELECEQCTFVARDAAEMSRHHLVHSFNRPHACTMCGFSSKSRDELSTHVWKYHPAHAEELAATTPSGSTTPSKSRTPVAGMNEDSPSHNSNAADTSGSSAHSGEFGYDDVIIVTPNTTEVPLVRGRKSGKGGTSSSAEILLPYKCSVCEYRARWPSEITQHMKNHSDEKPYHCPRCTYKSKWKWDVVKHLKRCGGGTVKDVIDTSRHYRKSESETSPTSSQSVVKQLQFRNSSPKQLALSNGPPNVTVMPGGSPRGMVGSHEAQGCYSPTSNSSDIIPYSRNTSSPANSVSSESANANDPNESGKAKEPVFRGVVSQGLYHCLQCPFVGNSPAELKRHCRVHSDEKPFSCQTCGYSSKWKCDLKKHIRTYNHRPAPRSHSLEDKQKEDSLKQFMSAEDDMSSSDEQLSVDLTQGEQQTASQDESAAPKPTLYKCDKCQYVTYKKNFLDGHMKIHRQANQKSGKLKCKQCDFEASDLPSFLQHKLTHSAQQSAEASPNPGDSANTLESSKAEREASPTRHRRKPLKYLSCSKCPYTCVKQTKLDIHEAMHEPRGPNALTCEFCDYNVYTRALLVQHMKLHPEFDEWYAMHGDTLEEELQNDTKALEEQEGEEVEHAESLLNPTTGDVVNLSKPKASGMKLMVANPKESGLGFRCSKCSFSSESRVRFEAHIRQHGSGQQYQCEHCDWSVDRLNHLYKHVREVHPQQLTLKDTSDGNTTPREGTPVKEDKSDTKPDCLNGRKKPRRSQICADCGYVSDNITKMALHKVKHDVETEKKCHYCSATMDSLRDMHEHLWFIHEVQVGGQEEESLNHQSVDTSEQKGNTPSENSRKRTRSKSPSSRRLSSLSPARSEADSLNDEPSPRQLIDVKGQKVYMTQNGNRKVFACPKCPYRTNNSSHCVSHVQQHGSSKKYTCEFCDYSLEKLGHIFHHMKMCHSNEIDTTDTETEAPTSKKGARDVTSGGRKQISCSHCPYTSKNMETLQRHIDMHEYTGQYTCEQCDFSVDQQDQVQQHMRVHDNITNNNKESNKRKIIPSRVSKRAKKAKLVYRPVLQKPAVAAVGGKGRKKTRYRCARCPYSTACKSNIFKHRRLHTVASKHKCPQCNYSATKYYLLKQHLSFHSNNGNPSSTLKDDGIYRDVYLENEAELATRKPTNGHSRKSAKVSNCSECPFTSRKPSDLKKHQTHHGARQKYSCDFCSFSVSRINILNQHRSLHDGKEGYKVAPDQENLLNKITTSKTSRHTLPKLRIVLKPIAPKDITTLRKASSIAPKRLYNCPECPFACNKRQSYENHARLHGATGRFQCQYCNYTVDRTNLMQQHVRLHQTSPASSNGKNRFTKKRFRCAKCPYHTYSKPRLDMHVQLHGGQGGTNGDHERSNFYNHKTQHMIVESRSREGSLEPSNNNNKDIKRGSVCQFCERNFADESEKDRHEQQHLLGTT